MANIQRNSFDVPRANEGNSTAGYGIGVNIEKGSLYELSSNIFKGQGTDPKLGTQCGVRIENCASDESVVHTNTYDYLGTGNLSNELNRGVSSNNDPLGLQFTCNTHSATTFDEAARGTDPNTHGFKATQGLQTDPAGNVFNGGPGARL